MNLCYYVNVLLKKLHLKRPAPHVAKLNALLQMMGDLMNTISEFAEKQSQYNERMNEALKGISGDFKNLQYQINVLQANTGGLSQADKDALIKLSNNASDLADKLDALDAINAPALPVEPVEPQL